MSDLPFVVTSPVIDAARHARLVEEQEVRRAERDVRRAVELEQRRLLLPVSGPELRDLESAVRCSCSCHPRPASLELHDGGVSCPCQLSEAERKQSLSRLFEISEQLRPSDEQIAERDAALAALAERLGVELDHVGGAAPFVVRGRVDGRAFFLRERHDLWRVEIAGDEHPLLDPWGSGPEHQRIQVASGSSSDLEIDGRFSELAAVEVAVVSVRLFLLRRACGHDRVLDARFCPDCGVERAVADRWRVFTSQPGV